MAGEEHHADPCVICEARRKHVVLIMWIGQGLLTLQVAMLALIAHWLVSH